MKGESPGEHFLVGRWSPQSLTDDSTQLLRDAATTLVAATLAETRTYLGGLVEIPRIPLQGPPAFRQLKDVTFVCGKACGRGIPKCRAPEPRAAYSSGVRLEAIFMTCLWSSVSQASTPRASASDRPPLTAASCVEDVA